MTLKKEYIKCIKHIIYANKKVNKANPEYKKYIQNGYCGRLIYNCVAKRWEFTEDRGMIECDKKDKIIIFVLESPHIDEYDENGMPKWPLVKINCFKKNIDMLLSAKLKPSNSYSIYFINAIRLQCSLGMPTEYYRDFIFLYYWGNGKKRAFERDLINFLKTNGNNVAYIINTVTKGSHKKTNYLYNTHTKQFENVYKNCGKRFCEKVWSGDVFESLQELVEFSINDVLKRMKIKNLTYLTGTHPSGWYNKSAKIN